MANTTKILFHGWCGRKVILAFFSFPLFKKKKKRKLHCKSKIVAKYIISSLSLSLSNSVSTRLQVGSKKRSENKILATDGGLALYNLACVVLYYPMSVSSSMGFIFDDGEFRNVVAQWLWVVVIVVDWLLTSKKVNGIRETLVTNGFEVVHCQTALLAQFALDERLQNVATSLQTNE